MEKIRLLLAEDDPNLSLVLKDFLEMQEYEVVSCSDGIKALAAYRSQSFDICIFDIMMPGKDGFSLSEDIRKLNKKIPIVFLTARDQKEDKIKGFKMGCDDYITKPFSTEELNLRIKAIIRRCRFDIEYKAEYFKLGTYYFDYNNRLIIQNKKKTELTKREAELLKLLFINRNKIISRDEILLELWGNDNYFNGRSLDVFISRIRKFFKDDNTISVTNIHGTGFRFSVPENY